MRTLINFGTLKIGGGQNVALNFLHAFFSLNINTKRVYFFVAKGSQIHEFLLKHAPDRIYAVPANPVKRILFEVFVSRYFLRRHKIRIIYSYFGFGLFPRNYKQIIGSVDSNLYYPEVNFWEGYKGINLLIKQFIDWYRKFG